MGTTTSQEPALDWGKATLIAALGGGLFWGLTAGLVTVTTAARSVVVAVVAAAVALVIAGVILSRQGNEPTTRVWGMGVLLAPLTGAVPILILWLPGVLGALSG